MSVTSNRVTSVTFTGDLDLTVVENATANAASPGGIQSYNLASGNNTITLPATPVSATIIPPTDNTETITLKGISGDTGLKLSPTDPTVLAFDPNNLPASFLLVAGDTITGLRIIWA